MRKKKTTADVPVKEPASIKFNIDFKNPTQQLAYRIYQQHDIVFFLGAAGTGKTHLASAFAIQEILNKTRSKIILTRPIVEAGEKLGYLPGDFEEKVNPYMLPIYDCMDSICGGNSQSNFRQKITNCCEIAPLSYMRGRTFSDAICIFDEAQNATYTQLKLFLTRMGENTKLIITGDPSQIDIDKKLAALSDVVGKLHDVQGIGVVQFKEDAVVRHPLVIKVLERLT